MTLFLGDGLAVHRQDFGLPVRPIRPQWTFRLGLYQGQGVSGENQWSGTIGIFATAEQITPDMLPRVFRATEERWDMCFDLRGHHVEMY